MGERSAGLNIMTKRTMCVWSTPLIVFLLPVFMWLMASFTDNRCGVLSSFSADTIKSFQSISQSQHNPKRDCEDNKKLTQKRTENVPPPQAAPEPQHVTRRNLFLVRQIETLPCSPWAAASERNRRADSPSTEWTTVAPITNLIYLLPAWPLNKSGAIIPSVARDKHPDPVQITVPVNRKTKPQIVPENT